VYQQSVIPEFTPKFCKRCKTFGHVEGTCGKGLEERQQKAVVAMKKSLPRGGVGDGPVGLGGAGAVKGTAPCLSTSKDLPGASLRPDGLAANPGLSIRPAEVLVASEVVGDGGLDKGRAGGAGLLPSTVVQVASGRPAAATVVGAQVDGAGRAGLGASHAVVDDSVRPAVAWSPPWPEQPASAEGVGDSAGQGKGAGDTASKGKELLVSGHPPVVEDSRQGPVQIGSSDQGASTMGRKGKKKKKKSGKGDVLHDQQQSEGEDPLLMPYPYDGLEDCLEGGIIGGKKGRRMR